MNRRRFLSQSLVAVASLLGIRAVAKALPKPELPEPQFPSGAWYRKYNGIYMATHSVTLGNGGYAVHHHTGTAKANTKEAAYQLFLHAIGKPLKGL